MLYGVKRVATVIAKTNCILGLVYEDKFKELIREYPEVERLMKDEAKRRVNKMQAIYQSKGKSFDLDPLLFRSQDVFFVNLEYSAQLNRGNCT